MGSAWVSALAAALVVGGCEGFCGGGSPAALGHRGAVARRCERSVVLRATLVPEEEEAAVMATLRDAIKAVAVGVKGSKPIPEELASGLVAVLRRQASGGLPGAARERLASFIGTLFVKEALSGADVVVLGEVARLHVLDDDDASHAGRVREGCSSGQVLEMALRGRSGGSGSAAFRALLVRLLDRETLSEADAFELGRKLFDSREPVEGQVLAAHVLRVRYETADEWAGLLRAQTETVDTARWDATAARAALNESNRVVVQFCEPFDGTLKAESFAPLLARHVQREWADHVKASVSQCAESAGPKYGPNLRELAVALQDSDSDTARFAERWEDVVLTEPPAFGWYVDQPSAAPALARWLPTRQNVMKRPFLATSEKFVDTCGASVLVCSAFHPSFSDKMFALAERATDFHAVIVLRKGCEGGLGLSLARAAEFSVGVRGPDGAFQRTDFSFGPDDLPGLAKRPVAEEHSVGPLCAKDTAERIRRFAKSGTSGNAVFDDRVKLTLAAFDKALGIVFHAAA